MSIAELLVSLLGSNEKQASAKAAHAISRFALANTANQVAIASAGGVKLLVKLLDPPAGTYKDDEEDEAKYTTSLQKEMASAIWAMATRPSPTGACWTS